MRSAGTSGVLRSYPMASHACGAWDSTSSCRPAPSSPIYGMPILDVDQARSVVVLKRSMNPGFSGIENKLFCNPNTSMLFGDARASLTDLVAEVEKV